MKKLLITILLYVLLFSCTTLPNPEENNLGLLVIPLELKNREELNVFGKYKLTMTNNQTEKDQIYYFVPNQVPPNIFMKPGTYHISKLEYSFKDGNSYHTITGTNLNYNFSIEQGKVTIFQKKLSVTMYSKNNKTLMKRDLLDTTPNDIRNLKRVLRKMQNSQFWDI